jgi:hypothetical protein
MSLENEIKKLRESIEYLGSAVTNMLEPYNGLEYSIDELKHAILGKLEKPEFVENITDPKKTKAKKEVEVIIKPAPKAVEIPSEVKELSVGYKPLEEIAPVEEQSKSIEKVEIKKEEDEIEISETVTYDDLQELAKAKMKLPNIDRNDIKKIVNDIKKDAQISDLNTEELAIAYENINKLG